MSNLKFFSSTIRFTANKLLWLSRVAWVLGLLFVGFLIYSFLFSQFFDRSIIILFLVFWGFSSYLVIPRVHRFFTGIYIPDYFVGRTKTGDGFYGDPVNVAINAKSEKVIHDAMTAAGWVLADELSAESSWKMIKSVVLRRSYPSAPVSSLFLFSRKQDFCYQQEVEGNPHARHHVRFWKTPKGWRLPGGHKTDWLAAGTYDRSVGFSTLTFQFTHKIAENIDEERDFIIETLSTTAHFKEVEVIKYFTSSYHSKNGGGDTIKTDGSLPFVTLV